jgi:biotin transport system substrate-specific component
MFVKTRNEEFSLIKSITTSTAFQVILFSLLTAVAAQIAVPVKPVPFTLQTMMVAISGAMLGARKGAYSQMLYILMGISGLPVFAQIPEGALGIARLFGPTGGYILAFPAAAYMTGLIVEKNKSYFTVALAMFLGNVIIILSGVSYLYVFWIRDLKEAFAAGAVIFSFWTVIKVIAGTSIFAALNRKK